MFGWEYVPDWFLWFALAVFAGYILFIEWFMNK